MDTATLPKDHVDATEQTANEQARADSTTPRERVTLACGWGRLLFGQTFDSSTALAEALRGEQEGQRDIAIYVREPHVALARAPQELFLDPSHTFRRVLDPAEDLVPPMSGYRVRQLATHEDGEQITKMYHKRRMVPVEPWFSRDSLRDGGTLA